MTDLEDEVKTEMERFDSTGIRSIFSDIDLRDIKANRYEFPVTVDNEPAAPVKEGEKLPRKGTEYNTKEIEFDKFGFEVTGEESTEDIKNSVERLNAIIDYKAVRELYDNSEFSWARSDRLDIVETAIMEAGPVVPYSKQDTVVVPQVLGESIADADPTRDWDEIVDDLEEEYSTRIITDSFNVLRGSDVVVADADFYGYDATRMEPTTNSYMDYMRHNPVNNVNVPEEDREVLNEVVQVYLRKGFVVIDESAAHIVRFGNV